jgi:hypothetical protein
MRPHRFPFARVAKSPLLLALIILTSLLAGCASRSRPAGLGYALASTTLTSPASVEMRTSMDGITWATPSALFASSTIPGGIGATTDRCAPRRTIAT